jgi:CHAT domain-containing protein
MRNLPPNQTLQREITGAETHAYRFDLRTDEFFQVRVEQKGVDVLLKLVDVGGNVLTSMDSPNEKDGPETLTWVVTQAGSYELDVVVFEEKAGKGIYTIRRETPRTATPPDKRRVEVERLFAEGMAARDKEGQAETAIAKLKEAQHGWEELNDVYMSQLTARQISNIQEAQNRPNIRALAIGETVEREIKGGSDQHFYVVALEQGQLLQISVWEKGVDLRVVLATAEDPKLLRKVDFDYGYGLERLTAVAEQAGRYAILIVPSESSSSGSYRLLAEVKAAATASDREYIDAERLLAGGIDSWNEGSGEGLNQAILKWEEALPLWKKVGAKYWEGLTLLYLGKVYKDVGKYRPAFENLNQSLTIFQAIGDKHGEAGVLNNIGKLYSDFGDPQKALVFDQQALELLRAVGDKLGEALMLINIGMDNYDIGEYQQAVANYDKALPLVRALRRTTSEAVLLNDIGGAYESLGNREKALDYYNQSLLLRRADSDKQGEANTLGNISLLYTSSREYQKALDYNGKALLLRKIVGIEPEDAVTLGNRMFITGLTGKRRLAILHGKQAVNEYQKLRYGASGLDNRAQKSLLGKLKQIYQLLSELLIAEGQLEQAVQVLNLYQDQQFFDFNHDPSLPVRQVVFSPRQQEFINRYRIVGERLKLVGSRLEALRQQIGNSQPSEQQSSQQKEYEAELQSASESFTALLEESVTEFAEPRDEKDKVPAVADVTEMRAALHELDAATRQKSAVIYTFMGMASFHLLLITADGEVKNFEAPVNADDMNRRCLKFYSLLQSPNSDPRPVGKELYDVVFKPVEAELQRQGVRTLMWQLDGNLRYVPVAALFDGERFLVERFQNVTFTRADRERMTRQVSRSWTGFGFGSSQEQRVDLLGNGDTITFPELPGVTRELQAIFRTGNSGAGILNGKVFVDARFTQSLFYEVMQQHPPLVHIASHFAFRPGDDSRSFLLLGDGTALTLSEMKGHKDLFAGVELLTLSACNTAATQADANGKEIDGFAELAQRLGAGAVMASLWPVADESTELLMTEFYRLRKENPLLTKAAALQLAQQKMLAGKLQPTPNVGRGGTKTVKSRADLVGIPAFPFDKTKPYAHPYYWSPFVLIGNWR